MSESKWLKCDLHTHSQYSGSIDGTRVKKMSAKEFVDTLLANGIELFSITDHNTFSAEYYKQIRKYIKDNNLDIRIIDGAELNVYIDSGNFFHAGFYFENASNEEAQNNLEESIRELYANDAKPKLSDIMGKFGTLRRKVIIIPEGTKTRGILKILGELNPDEVEWANSFGMYKVFSAYDMSLGFDAKGQNLWAKGFYEQTSSLRNLNIPDEEWAVISDEICKKIKNPEFQPTREKAKELYKIICEYGKYFTYFSFSDWHNNEPYEPKLNNFIYGNLDRAFDSLEIAVYDPDSRVIRTTESSIIIPNNILRSVSFKINGKKTKVDFSSGMNAIIGKRGSGKTLLASVIQKLHDKTNETIDSYRSRFKISDVEAVYWDGSIIKEGGLSSISILKQEQIKDIYQNPEAAGKKIEEKFPEIKEYPIEPINKIVEVLKNIAPIKKNYKNIRPFLRSDDDEVGVLVVSPYVPSYDDYKLSVEIEEMSQNLKNLRYKLREAYIENPRIERAIDELNTEFVIVRYLMARRKEFIGEIASMIKDKVKTLSDKQTEVARKKEEKINILSEIEHMFDIELNVRKLEILANNPNFEMPSPEISREGDYLFITSYLNDSNASDDIWEKIEEPIKKRKAHAEKIELVKKYVNGEVELKAGEENLWKNLKSFYSGKIVEPLRRFYSIENSSVDECKLINNDAIENEVKRGWIQDLSKASPGTKAVAYLNILFGLDDSIFLLDQPEDNIDNEYIADFLVDIIRTNKKKRQLIFVTHNPTIAVYGDAFSYIHATNDDNEIRYENHYIESQDDKKEIIKILDGGRKSFSNRNKKYGNILGEEEYGTTTN